MRSDGERRVVGILFALFGTVMMDRQAVAFLGPFLVTEFHLTPAQIGLVSGATSIAWAISALALGSLSDRIGRKRVLVPATVAFSLLSMATGLTRTFEELVAVRVLMGIAEGPCIAIVMALAASVSSERRIDRNVGLITSAGPLVGTAIAPIVATLAAEKLGWRVAFTALGVPGLLLAIAVARHVAEPPRRETHEGSGRIRDLLKLREILYLQIAGVGFMGWLLCHLVFGPLYMTEVGHRSPAFAGSLIGATGIGGFAFSVFGPRLWARIDRRFVLGIFAAISALVPLEFLLVDLATAHPALVVVALAASNASAAVASLLLFALPMEAAPPHLRASAVGLTSFSAEMIGATLTPIAGGLLADVYGLSAPLWLGAGAMVVAGIFGVLAAARLARR